MTIPSETRASRMAAKCSGSVLTSTPSKSKITAFIGIANADCNLMSRLLIQLAAALLLLIFLWRAFRFAMGLRWGRVQREQARRDEEARGRRVVAELPARDEIGRA